MNVKVSPNKSLVYQAIGASGIVVKSRSDVTKVCLPWYSKQWSRLQFDTLELDFTAVNFIYELSNSGQECESDCGVST